MKVSFYPLLIALVVVVLGGSAYAQLSSSPSVSSKEQSLSTTTAPATTPSLETPQVSDEKTLPSTPVSEPVTSTPTGITMAEVAQHASAESCWSVVRGNVYDLTTWIAKHPGGKSSILRMCGTDATASFEGQHGGDARPEQALASFLIGPLAQ